MSFFGIVFRKYIFKFILVLGSFFVYLIYKVYLWRNYVDILIFSKKVKLEKLCLKYWCRLFKGLIMNIRDDLFAEVCWWYDCLLYRIGDIV